ncbi:AarF/ABC1/UbiB kinase family protein [Alkalibacter rhizosphaerae]|uniref:AarF/ABC1/UbiB kinase family protein n=1 Tax=Alkalibacter rhizosphaerae TaxID=2815577 RepID=A0A974XFV3_9FIRM|nr:AarF/ABC1/UbiB kinase family protein [Alkalibacter rhizosphaerae]QSX07865.1 AarF/ABC1/UbiB kinase family protein [Alkalibacter rhizosphaerae]
MLKSKRFRQIVRAFSKYGFGHFIHTTLRSEKTKRDPENLKHLFEELGPTFMKLGQILSTRPDLVPPEYRMELTKLQDNASPFPWESVEKILAEDLGPSYSAYFSHFEKIPIACASVAQVHEALLSTGEAVIVKVRRPDIEETFLEDLDILIYIAQKMPNSFKDVLLDPVDALREIKETSILELDFANELAYMERFQEENQSIACISLPKVFPAYCSSRLVVQEKIDGIKINNMPALKEEGYDLEDIGKKLVLSFLYQVLETGFFHGDPHPGNLLIRDGKIYYIDFGIMGSLSTVAKGSTNEIVKSLAVKDVNALVNLMLRIGIYKGPIDRNQLYEDVETLLNSYFLSSFRNIQVSRLLMDVFDAARKNNLRVPREYTMLLKSLVILEGVVSELSPDLNIIELARHYTKGDIENPLKDLQLETLLLGGHHFVRDLALIPSSVQTILDNFISGRGKVKINITNLDEKWVEFNKMVNRMVFALLVSALIVASALIVRSGQGPSINGISIVGLFGFGLAGLLSLWLMFSILKSGNI